ncbi:MULTISPECIES: sigma-54 interaction domain-containing protein [Bacillus]|uniref:sigma-54 interaction domain-containing protein n=1 Tax=Bacillus TaxID=1386 RepID=UPI0002FF74B2|nr:MULTISPECIES: sigma 54-interacting transcriptional regulator [Bacillus]
MMERYYSSMTVEEAILRFPRGNNVVEVSDESEKFIGFLTMESLARAVQKGELTKTISHLVTINASLKDIKHHSIDYEEFKSFFESELCRSVFDSLYDGVYITDGAAQTLFINKAYQRITGIKKEEVIGKNMNDLVNQGIISSSASLDAIRTKRQVTLIQTIRGERKILVSATPVFSSSNDVMFVINSVRDITELITMKHALDKQNFSYQNLLGTSPSTKLVEVHDLVIGSSISPLFKLADKVAKTDAKVLLQGETGVGKSLIAKYVHSRSSRSHEVFIELNCAAIPEHLVESELFGYEAGAFTGALKQGKMGIFEKTNGGTLFLDEIGDLPLDIQVKLLKVVEDSQFNRVGSTEMKKVDVRIITATHRDLAALVHEGKFREDLYYRLNIVSFEVPPLRERKEEIVPLLEMYMNKFNNKYNENKSMTPECIEWLTNYSWPGNIRELANLAERLVVTTFQDRIDVVDLPPLIQPVDTKANHQNLREAVGEVERTLIINAMKKHGSTRASAKVLGISQSSLVQKMKKYHIRVENES